MFVKLQLLLVTMLIPNAKIQLPKSKAQITTIFKVQVLDKASHITLALPNSSNESDVYTA